MKPLYLKAIELLEQVPELRYIDLNFGQLQAEKPPLDYPAALINLSVECTTVDGFFQINTAQIEITLIFKSLGETNNIAPEAQRELSLKYMEIGEKVHAVMQGYKDKDFDAFTRLSVRDADLRRGLKTVVCRYETAWRSDVAK